MLFATFAVTLPIIIGSCITNLLQQELRPISWLTTFTISASQSGFLLAFCDKDQGSVGIHGLITSSLFGIVLPILSAMKIERNKK